MLAKTHAPPTLDARCITQFVDHIPDFYQVFPCGKANVCDALQDEVEYWDARNPVMIVAPTGRGKTTLIYREVIPRAIQEGKYVLLISNRIALSIQMKLELAKIVGFEKFAWLNDTGQRHIEKLGQVAVVTYHRLPAFLSDPENKAWLENVGYVVADEAHFFTADSSFNEKCGYYLKLLTSDFCDAVRIYLTATPWDVYYPLAEAEKNNYVRRQEFFGSWRSPRAFRLYRFDADYHHVNLNFFIDLKEIGAMIEASAEKWIVFVDNKVKGKEFANGLGDRAIYLDADSKETAEWNRLLRESRFDAQVLVTTAVLDCGVNIIDPAVGNVAVVCDNRTGMIQQIGRKRCMPGARLNLYVCDISLKIIGSRYQDCLPLCEWYDRYLNSTDVERKKMAREIWHESNEKLRHYFDLTNGGYLVPNRIAFFTLERRRRFYEKILSGEVTFRQEVQRWLGLESDTEVEPEEELLRFCEVNLGQELEEAQSVMLRKLIIAAAKRRGFVEQQPKRVDTLGREALNNRLRFISSPYAIEKNTWRINQTGGNIDG